MGKSYIQKYYFLNITYVPYKEFIEKYEVQRYISGIIGSMYERMRLTGIPHRLKISTAAGLPSQSYRCESSRVVNRINPQVVAAVFGVFNGGFA